MKLLWLVMFVSVILGCQEPVPGSCYPNPAGGAGGADSMAVGAGVGATTSGDYAEPPRQPQDETNPPPECNIVTQSPCNEKCEADYESAAIVCGKIENEAQRKTCNDSAYASYRSCRGNCPQKHNRDCDDKYLDCQDHGPTSCLKKVGGQSLCQRCWERCNAGDSPSPRCRDCKF